MENEIIEPTPETKETGGTDSRLLSLAEKSGLTVDEFLANLEEKQKTEELNTACSNQSVGPQSKNAQDTFDPTGTEFLKGLWGK